jgi:hypothetical protein
MPEITTTLHPLFLCTAEVNTKLPERFKYEVENG